ncbi:hypothetical protein [Acidovorax sp. sic0104]|uniref:hypothetical protein n=1 Tax=Acidovorax sp. sic0104 TaxID=2854784 RepID=UPI001C44975A|nr:hypothetical protein [Acidovorax sp. sic0104]MBV7542051.1 hypothetical protein [Acidovorax sp. sic0104]
MADREPAVGVDAQELQDMRQLCRGEEEWRVEHPVTGSYCFTGSKGECDSWLVDHRSRNPRSPYCAYVVKQRFVQSQAQLALERCIDEIERLHAMPFVAAALASPPSALGQANLNPYPPQGVGRAPRS